MVSMPPTNIIKENSTLADSKAKKILLMPRLAMCPPRTPPNLKAAKRLADSKTVKSPWATPNLQNRIRFMAQGRIKREMLLRYSKSNQQT
mmetsp:Transcript_25631/g.55345  ORF Transcript_25631/g.55345 Transcript_25631/m.55345 type:complete len:90 (-) Transcript_25631:1341-1610(-)